MDLISREAAIEAIKDPVVKGFAMYVLKSVPAVPAVPLDKLCEWLGKFANPCKIGIRCYYPDDNNEDCMPTVECWRYVLTKWMEEQDAEEET